MPSLRTGLGGLGLAGRLRHQALEAVQEAVEAGIDSVEEGGGYARFIAHTANAAFEGEDDGGQALGEGWGC